MKMYTIKVKVISVEKAKLRNVVVDDILKRV